MDSSILSDWKIYEAKEFARQAHQGQTYDEHDYVYHLESVVNVLKRFGFESGNPPDGTSSDDVTALISAAWLHDVLEDTEISAYTLKQEFGDRIYRMVEAVTDARGYNRAEKKAKTYPKIRKFGRLAVILKLADRIANVENALSRGVHKLFSMYRREHKEFKTALYMPDEAEDMWSHLEQIFAKG